MNAEWKVHKFGGTSVLNAERYRNVLNILLQRFNSTVLNAVVVSAMKGVTDDLIQSVELAQSQGDYQKILDQILVRHLNVIEELLKGSKSENLIQVIRKNIQEISEILRGVWLVKSASSNVLDLVSGMGEIWSAQILWAYAEAQGHSCSWLDARTVLVVRPSMNQVVVDWTKTEAKFKAWLEKNKNDLVIISGFVASLEDGTMTTLGRNGSDFSGSIFGSLFNASEVYIWTDVDGVLSADPRLVPEALVLDELSYSEVSELAFFGAKVVHPSTMAPVIDKKIPIWIKNTLNPEARGTKIHFRSSSTQNVRGFSSIEKMALINVEGSGMVGIPGVAERLFGALRSAKVNVVLISQASSEHSICFAVSEIQAEPARIAMHDCFRYEIQMGLIEKIQVSDQVSILAAVGDNMAQSPGVSGQFFTALGRAGINIRAIAQGSSERNISVVIDSKEAKKALRTVHSAFVVPHLSVALGLVGVGTIGSTFLYQLHEQMKGLINQRKIDVQVLALADSKKMWLSDQPIPLQDWKSGFEKNSTPLDQDKLREHLVSTHLPHCAVIDATASSQMNPLYLDWLKAGLHVISPNKKTNSGSFQDYQHIRATAKKMNRHFLYSTNVGAGLPILQTLKDLYNTGDDVQLIQGIFSGTLSYLFNQFGNGMRFSEIVLEAKKKGYTEPDPREDLSGQDVVRKLVILARETGLQIECNKVRVEGLVPSSLLGVSPMEFMQRLSELDGPMQKRLKKAQEKNEVLRFVGTLNKNGEAKVGLESLPAEHVLASVTGTDNIVLFQTRRYFHQPLVIRGPGAGPEVTAAGVFADLLRLTQYVGAVL